MPTNLKRYYGQNDLHFLTFSCYHRRPFLANPEARHRFVSSLTTMRERYRFLLIGYVVMPEHVHLLISETPKGDPSSIVKALKRHVSQHLVNAPRPKLWQPRFYDFNVRSDKKIREKLDYMHLNPYKRGLVEHPRDWPWSSFLNYQEGKTSLIAIDYA